MSDPWYLAGGVHLENCLAAYSPFGAASLAASYINLALPGTRDAVPGVAPTWDAVNGWKLLAGSMQWLDTTIVAVAGYSAIVKFSNVATIDSYLFGISSGGSGGGADFGIIPNLSGAPAKVRYLYGDNIGAKAPELLEGILAIAGPKAYRAGIDEGLTVGAWTGTTAFSINVGRLNRAAPSGYITAYIQRLAIYNIILTATQVAAITAGIASPLSLTPAGAGEFMLVFMTDTHYNDGAAVHSQMTQYVAAHRAELGIQIVLHGGDVVQPPNAVSDPVQWAAAGAMFDNLDAAGIPYLLTAGNHDYDGDIDTDVIGRDAVNFNATFPQARYTGQAGWSGGFYEAGRSENAYRLMTIDSVDWLFVVMEFGPRAAVLAWLDALLTTYVARHAVVVTHSYLHRDGTTAAAGDQYAATSYTLDGDRNNGDEIWAMLKTHDNVRLVLSGHDKGVLWASATRVDDSDGGVPINQAVANFQVLYEHKSGMMQFIRIKPSTKAINVQTFSPRFNMMMHDAANEYAASWA